MASITRITIPNLPILRVLWVFSIMRNDLVPLWWESHKSYGRDSGLGQPLGGAVVLITHGSGQFWALLIVRRNFPRRINKLAEVSSLQQGFQRSSTLDHSQMNKCKKFPYSGTYKMWKTGPVVNKTVCLMKNGNAVKKSTWSKSWFLNHVNKWMISGFSTGLQEEPTIMTMQARTSILS